MPKSYWMPISCDSDRDKAAIRSWFSPLCDDMTPEKADVLCDMETDREKKARALMVANDGKRHWAIRTSGKTYSITLKAA